MKQGLLTIPFKRIAIYVRCGLDVLQSQLSKTALMTPNISRVSTVLKYYFKYYSYLLRSQ